MRKLFYFGLVLALFASCEKNDSTTVVDPTNKANYFPLHIGNYWVYNHYNIDTLGIETKVNRTDSVILNRDTIINGNKYYILEETNYPFNEGKWGIINFLRDSSGYIINVKGQIEFSADNFTDTLASKVEIFNKDTLYVLSYQMEKTNTQIVVPAGKFEVLNYKGTVNTYKPSPGVKKIRYINNFFAVNIGIIQTTYFYYQSPIISEKRLVRYKIKKE